MKKIKNYIYSQVTNHELSREDAKQMLLEIKEADDLQEDIAIIGMSGKFPCAENIEEYWENISSGKSCINEIPKERVKDVEDYLKYFYYDQLQSENKIKTDGSLDITYEKRGYMKQIDCFDADFFGIPPREAKAMDPSQRMFLEIVNEAMEDAGYGGNRLHGSNTGVFVGFDHVCGNLYKDLAGEDPMVVTGTWPGVLAGRISYVFNFHGPCMVIDTACSSGLVCVNMACNALGRGDSEIAIAGGLSGFTYKPFKFRDELKELDTIESKDATVRTFDKAANGTVWGEGVGAVVLKSLKKALADGDSIYAVIKGSQINSDGASNGITAPDADAQEKLLCDVWNKAKIEPETIQYIEAHGTGTVLGDPIEVKGITNAFRHYTDKKQFCGIASSKTEIGHLVAASGIASLIKVVMMLKNKVMIPNINFKTSNTYINFCDSPVYVCDKLMEWESTDTPRRAGINSFGFSGTNCHVLLEEAPIIQEESKDRKSFEILTLSAKNENVLRAQVKHIATFLATNEYPLEDICYTLNTGRGHYSHRIALIVKNLKDLKEKINYLLEIPFSDVNKFGVYYGEHRIVSQNKTVRTQSEITEAEKRKINNHTKNKIQELMEEYEYSSAAELCGYYVKGASIEWDDIYKDSKLRKVHLPVYPLEKTRCWFTPSQETKQVNNDINVEKKKVYSHPLIDRCLAESYLQDIYVTDFQVKNSWILQDHVILSEHIIPGTTYIEMAVELTRKYYGNNVEIKNGVYYSPVVVENDEIREVHSILTKYDDYIVVTFASKVNVGEINEKWVKHAECNVYPLMDKPSKVYDIDSIKNKLLQEGTENSLIDLNTCPTNHLGHRWDNITELIHGKSEALVHLALPEDVQDDVDDYCLHVSLLDNAINGVSQQIGEVNGAYLPFIYKNIKVMGKIYNDIYSYIRIHEKMTKGKETITCDVSIMDNQGRVFAEIADFSTKKVDQNDFEKKQEKETCFFGVNWRSSSIDTDVHSLAGKKYLIFNDASNASKQIIEKLRADGAQIFVVVSGSEYKEENETNFVVGDKEEDYLQLIQKFLDKELSGIVYVAGMSEQVEGESVEQLKEQLNAGIYGMLSLVKALAQNKFSAKLDFLLVMKYASEVTKEECIIHPFNAALEGMCKVVALELPNLSLKCIDIDDESNLEAIIYELKIKDQNKMVAYRGNNRFIQEFEMKDLKQVADSVPKIKSDGVYVISGGTGALGLEMARYLSQKQSVNIALLNRSKMPEQDKWDAIFEEKKDAKLINKIRTIRDIENSGNVVFCLQADVTNLESMEKTIQILHDKFGNINGIIHCAGIAGNGFLMNKDQVTFSQVVLPKIQGTWILDKVTESDTMDFMILFSSITALFGDYGQGDYTAANSYLDAFAYARSKAGKRTIAVNWPAWKEVGMAADFGVVDIDSTVKPILTKHAFHILDEILGSNVVNIMPGELNFRKLLMKKEELPFVLSPQLEAILLKQQQKKPVEEKGIKVDMKVIDRKREITSADEIEDRLIKIWSEVLGIKDIDLYDNFSSLGGDSLMAIQMLKLLNEEFESACGTIDIVDIFSYPSIQEMAAHILETVERKKKNILTVGLEQNVETEVAATVDKKDNLIDNLRRELDGLNSGETSIEETLKLLRGEK